MSELVGAQPGPRHGKGRAIVRWCLAALGVPIMILSWVWLTLASTEQVTESAKEPAGETSTSGLFVTFGVVPILVVHLAGIVILRFLAPLTQPRARSWTLAVALVFAASAIGVTVALAFNGGSLLTPADGGYAP